jgi:bacteriorhodopsin
LQIHDEQVGFQFAWLSFYICWLIIAAGFGLAIFVCRFVGGMDTIFTGLYTILVSLWITIFKERWKSKSSEISMKWDIFKLKSEAQRDMRH